MPIIARATKGSLTVVETGERVEFMFNPAEFTDEKEVAYARQQVPGVSHPVLQYAAGGSRVVSFEVYLDGDRGRAKRIAPNELRDPARRRETLSVQDEIDFYRSLLYPVEARGQLFTDVHTPVVLFSFGTLYEAMPAVVTRATVTGKAFDPSLNPIRATVALQLEEKVREGRKRGEVYRAGSGGGRR